MKLSTLFVLSGIVTFVFSLAFFLVPETLLALYVPQGTNVVEAAAVGRLYGASVLGWAILDFMVRNAAKSEARDAIVMAKFLTWGLALVAALWVQLSGVLNALGWSTVVIHLLFTLVWGYFAFMKKEEPVARPA